MGLVVGYMGFVMKVSFLFVFGFVVVDDIGGGFMDVVDEVVVECFLGVELVVVIVVGVYLVDCFVGLSCGDFGEVFFYVEDECGLSLDVG